MAFLPVILMLSGLCCAIVSGHLLRTVLKNAVRIDTLADQTIMVRTLELLTYRQMGETACRRGSPVAIPPDV
jgi:formate-dependent nitrite reductase membrane component NrfD